MWATGCAPSTEETGRPAADRTTTSPNLGAPPASRPLRSASRLLAERAAAAGAHDERAVGACSSVVKSAHQTRSVTASALRVAARASSSVLAAAAAPHRAASRVVASARISGSPASPAAISGGARRVPAPPRTRPSPSVGERGSDRVAAGHVARRVSPPVRAAASPVSLRRLVPAPAGGGLGSFARGAATSSAGGRLPREREVASLSASTKRKCRAQIGGRRLTVRLACRRVQRLRPPRPLERPAAVRNASLATNESSGVAGAAPRCRYGPAAARECALIAHLRLSPLPRAPACPDALLRLRASVVVLRYRVADPLFSARKFSFSREISRES